MEVVKVIKDNEVLLRYRVTKNKCIIITTLKEKPLPNRAVREKVIKRGQGYNKDGGR